MGMTVIELVAGLALLVLGAELLVRGASQLAKAVGLPSLVVGLTVVAFGTSAPEFAVSLKASLAGQSDIALGNVVGSNTFNVLVILGLSALVMPLAVSSQLIRFDVPVMIGVSAAVWLAALDGDISRTEGVLLLGGLVVYTAVLIVAGLRKNGAATAGPGWPGDPAPHKTSHLIVSAVLVLAGLGMLVLGSRWLVGGATAVARALGISELVIGLTLVAAGTSLPELATSVIAAMRRERDIAVGNIVGSNIFNLLAVLGGAAAVGGRVEAAPAAAHFDLPVMVAAAMVCLPIFFTGGRICRWEGATLLAYYAAYTLYMFLAASGNHAVPALGAAILWFFLPGTGLGIGLSVLYTLRERRRRRADRATPP
ncbi:MAG TPA: calcium/sodium antiporter [Phycisphaerae bacterium]|mgnify:CR=1 FL=1|nr:calcium/sodium antiporter [Phycisphaerae bacterium]